MRRADAGDVIHVHYWSKTWIGTGDPPPGSSGHIGVSKGDLGKAHLQRKSGRYEVLLPNGFQKLDAGALPDADVDLLNRLQGKWDFAYYEEKGEPVANGTKQFVFKGKELSFYAGGEVRIVSTVEVKNDRLDQKFADGQVYRSIYTQVGDLLVLSGNRDKPRPTAFSGGGETGGEFLIVLRRQ